MYTLYVRPFLPNSRPNDGKGTIRFVRRISNDKRPCILVSSDSAISIANRLALIAKIHRTQLRLCRHLC